MPAVSEIMTSTLVTVDPGQTLRDAVETFRAEEVSGAPVTSGDEVVGVVSATDILEFQATHPGIPVERSGEALPLEPEPPQEWAEGDDVPSAYFVDFWSDVGAASTSRFDQIDGPEWDVLENALVAEVMTRTVLSVPPDADVRDAARQMLDAGVHRLLVLENGKLKGIVTATDVMRAVAEGIL